jgi:UDP-N-acetylmuramyl pentapeptide phosphotransferase/UDP-N-acetylglucosamine-1-phosphate transferase
MDKILLSGGLSFLITYFAIPIIIRVAKERKLFDEPDERKLHVDTIPTLGGLGIFAGFILASLLGSPQIAPPLPGYELQYFAAAAIIIFFLGMKDDIIILPASKKMAGQLIAAAILIKFGSTYINDMQGFLGIYQIPNVASIVLSAFTIIVITNSFNFLSYTFLKTHCTALYCTVQSSTCWGRHRWFSTYHRTQITDISPGTSNT